MTKRKNFFLLCFFSSLFLHACILFLVHRHSLWFYSPIKNSFVSKKFFSIEKMEKQKVLESVFKTLSDSNYAQRQKNLDFPKKEFISSLDNVFEKIKIPKQEYKKTDVAFKEDIKTENLLKKSTLSIPKIQTFQTKIHEEFIKPLEKLAQDFQIQKTREKLEEAKTKQISFESLAPFLPSFTNEEELATPNSPILNFEEKKSVESLQLVQAPSKTIQPSKKFQKPGMKFPSLKNLNTLSLSEDFHLEITYVPEGKDSYLFAITLIPSADINLPRIKQNFYFLIDRANTIQFSRLKASRDAIYHSLSYLQPQDQFNIIAFDNSHEQLFSMQSYLTPTSKKEAKRFLMNLKLASFFAQSNVFNPLYTLGFNKKNETEIDNVILLTNGESLAQDRSTKPYLMSKWNHFNQGKMCVFSICMEHDTRIRDLEILSILNRGWNTNSSTKGGIKRRTLKLMQSLKYPIAKNVSCSTIATAPSQHIELFYLPCQLQNLYIQKPYVFIGKTSSLEDFFIFIQGENNGKTLNIKKRISLKNAQLENRYLNKQKDIQKAYQLYYSYLYDLNPQHLKEAQSLLENYQMYPAFQ